MRKDDATDNLSSAAHTKSIRLDTIERQGYWYIPYGNRILRMKLLDKWYQVTGFYLFI